MAQEEVSGNVFLFRDYPDRPAALYLLELSGLLDSGSTRRHVLASEKAKIVSISAGGVWRCTHEAFSRPSSGTRPRRFFPRVKGEGHNIKDLGP